MNATLTIAGLTIKESVRRRLLLAFLAITVVIVGLSASGLQSPESQPEPHLRRK